MTKQYLNKREYLGKRKFQYYIKYGGKIVFVLVEWISREYEVTKAKLATFQGGLAPNDDFPYHRTPKVIDRIEELLK